MKAIYVQKGESVDFIPSANVSAGDVVVSGDLVGIAKLDIATSTLGSLSLRGVFDIVKASGAISFGAAVYWDETNSNATAVATGNKYLGKAVRSAESTDATVRVLLNAPYVADAESGG